MPVILTNQTGKSMFEQAYFDASPTLTSNATQFLQANSQLFAASLADIQDLAGAPSGSEIDIAVVPAWGKTGADRPPPGLYFSVTHPTFIASKNVIGLVNDRGRLGIYVKDVDLTDKAPTGMGALIVAKMVRFALRQGAANIRLLAAGGRYWPPKGNGAEWSGYYAWARYGFNMSMAQPLEHPAGTPIAGTENAALTPFFPHRPPNLANCGTVQDVLKENGGKDWWKSCGNGWFMEFDCSSATSASVAALEDFCKEKSI
ncbi:hypothetical protein [Burkholderia pseudomallei]|uniref:hypothetical protein n=1 Tax=Burkholderia pseudomallei TaxID=28450 RepID=UPI001115831D|nr:hypothetical protein [Burkholderia pseudomallei]UZU14155.1 hypothetical protein OSB53_14065 [Burkholderia pseudomallei]UZU22143.1 hypothetical protein OSB35_23970 [Burkholderia pseudomallei]UZU30528.1 hypothetical protein OSB54_19520 [Burkholderia pseudomallei]